MQLTPTGPVKQGYTPMGGSHILDGLLVSYARRQSPTHIGSQVCEGEDRGASRTRTKCIQLSLAPWLRDELKTSVRGFSVRQRIAIGALGVVLLLGILPTTSVAQSVDALRRAQEDQRRLSDATAYRNMQDNWIRQSQLAESIRQSQFNATRQIQETTRRPVERLDLRSDQRIDGVGAAREADRIRTENAERMRIQSLRDLERVSTERVEATRRAEQYTAQRINDQRVEAIRRGDQITAERLNVQRLDAERVEAVRRGDQLTADRINAQRVEAIRRADQLTADRINIERIDGIRRAEQLTAERINAQRIEAIRRGDQITAERLNAQRVDAIRRTEQLNTERITAERLDTERVNAIRRAEQLNTERVAAIRGAQRLDAERVEAIRRGDQLTALRLEGQRVEATRRAVQLNAQRLEGMRRAEELTGQRLEGIRRAEGLNAQRLNAERVEVIRRGDQLTAQRLESERVEATRRVDQLKTDVVEATRRAEQLKTERVEATRLAEQLKTEQVNTTPDAARIRTEEIERYNAQQLDAINPDEPLKSGDGWTLLPGGPPPPALTSTGQIVTGRVEPVRSWSGFSEMSGGVARTASTSTGQVAAAAPAGWRESVGASSRGSQFQSASAQTPRSVITAVRADVAESQAYMEALQRGEIGLQRPEGANVAGTDFITARIGPNGSMEVLVTDVKSSTVGKFPAPRTIVPAEWLGEVQAAVAPGRLNLNDPALETQIRAAVLAGRVVARQVNVNYAPTPQGQGSMTGF